MSRGPRSAAPLLGVVALLAVGACRREERPQPRPTPQSTPQRAAAPPPAAAPPTESASAPSPPPTPEAQVASKTVRAWNTALDRHDLVALEKLYAGSVLFYGRPRSRASVVSAKRAAFARQPGFRQELIGDVTVERLGDGTLSASFTKKAGPPEDFLVISGKLVLSPSASGYLVAAESDEASARRDASAQPSGSTVSDCEATASEVANALPEVKRTLALAMKEADESDGGARFGGMGPNDDGEGAFTAAMGLHTDDHFEARFVYSVDRNGRLTVVAGGQELEIPRSSLQAVAAACGHSK